MADNSVLQRSKNSWRCVGLVYENGLKLEDTEIKIKDDSGTQIGTQKGQRVMGSIAVKTDDGIFTMNVYAQSLTSKGEPTRQWKMYTDMVDWNPIVNGDGSEPTLVNLEGTLEINDYVNQSNEISTALRYRVNRGSTRVNEDEVKAMCIEGTYYIGAIQREVLREEETGRLVVTLYSVNGMGQIFPVTVYVKEDLADAFEDAYEVGQTVPMSLDVESRHIGGEVGEKKMAFGKASKINVNSGFDRIEIFISGANDVIEEPDESTLVDDEGNPTEDTSGYMSPKAVAKALKERSKMLEELKDKGYQGAGNGKPQSMKDRKKEMAKEKKTMPKVSTSSATVSDDDEDDPF